MTHLNVYGSVGDTRVKVMFSSLSGKYELYMMREDGVWQESDSSTDVESVMQGFASILTAAEQDSPSTDTYRPSMRSPRPRDSQRSKVYTAEGKTFECKEELSLAEMKAFILEVKASHFWQKRLRERFPNAKPGKIKLAVTVKDGRGRRSACARPTAWSISIPKFARNKWIVLHELAHLIQPAGTASHGREFCKLYLLLVRKFMGDTEWKLLKASFVKGKVKHTAPRKQLRTKLDGATS